MPVAPKKSILGLKAYANAKHGDAFLGENPRLMKLDSNEATVSPSPRVVAALANFIQSSPLNCYPDVESKRLIEKISGYTGLPEDHIQTFNGSDNALETICRTFLEKGDEVLLPLPTYDHFRVYAESCDAQLIGVQSETPFTTNLELLIAALSPQTRLIYLVSPNNPTGEMFTEKQISLLIAKAPHALIVVDEAYFEFCGITVAPLVAKHDNLLVTRSFSKAFGLAGLRCGYVLAQPSILESLNKVRIGKNINSLAQVAASAALDDVAYMEHFVSEVVLARKWLVRKIGEMGLKAVETPGNYILVKVARPDSVISRLEDKQVLIRNRSHLPGLSGYVRITIGHQLLMERFWRFFRDIPTALLSNLEKENTAESGAE